MTLIEGDTRGSQQCRDAIDRCDVAPTGVGPHEFSQRRLVGMDATSRSDGQHTLRTLDITGFDPPRHEPCDVRLLRPHPVSQHLPKQDDGVLRASGGHQGTEQRPVAPPLRERPRRTETTQPDAGIIEAACTHQTLDEVPSSRPVEHTTLVEQHRRDGQRTVQTVRSHLGPDDGTTAL